LGFASTHKRHMLLLILPLVTAGITTFYMFRMWFMTFTGKPKDHHVHDHAHESPRLMTWPLIILAVFALGVAWGWPLWDAESSYLHSVLHSAEPGSVAADFVPVEKLLDDPGGWVHPVAGLIAALAAAVGALFGFLLYYFRTLDPAETKEQFGFLYRLFERKWYFDELYSVLLVRPALVVAHWCRAADSKGIDRVIDTVGRTTVAVARGSGRFDN